MPDRLAL
ncbi:hypothetical protein YPPY47_2890, partial [Yersinia pestis PY-47]